MDYKPEAPFQKGAELGKLLNLKAAEVDAAHLTNDQGEKLIQKATSSKLRQKWITTPAGIVLIGCVAASAFGFVSQDDKDKEYPLPFKAVFMLAMAGYAVGRLSDREKALREQVRGNVIDVAVKRETQNRKPDL